jgi:hypothetical protein
MSDERRRSDDRAANHAREASVAAKEFVDARRSRVPFGAPLAGEVAKRGVSKDLSEPKASVVDGEADAVRP